MRRPQLRWFRTSLTGRLTGWPNGPAPVGPWRPITLTPAAPKSIWHRVVAEWSPAGATIDVEIETGGTEAVLLVGPHRFPLGPGPDGRVRGRFAVPGAQPWWPHTHGGQPLYPLAVQVDGRRHDRGRVGFRSVTVDRTDGGFTLTVNGVGLFCRGAHWTPLDPVSLQDDPGRLRRALEQVVDGNLNMIRIGGDTVYPSPDLLRLCDELGVMIWQDLMFAYADVPDDDALQESIAAEMDHQIRELAGHPGVVMLSGGSEIEQQATYFGVTADPLRARHHHLLPVLAGRIAALPSVGSTPTGGPLPTDPRSGVAHYFGVGAYLRPLTDARRAGVRFAAECLSFANPPERATVTAAFGGPAVAGHHPQWKAAVYRDAGASWDFEDVLSHYVSEIFGAQSPPLRFTDPDRALDLARATSAELFTATLSEWRRPGSGNAGALVFHHHDFLPGAGLGIVDAAGRPKSAWYALRRVCAPVAVLITDEGLNGLDAHLLNDTAAPVPARLRVDLFAGDLAVETVERAVSVPARSGLRVPLSEMFDGFRDLNHAHHFGPPAYDALLVTLIGDDGRGPELGRAVHCPVPHGPALDIGLRCDVVGTAATGWSLSIATRGLAQWVSIECDGHRPADSWFHLPPGGRVMVALTAEDGLADPPRGTVRAVNSIAVAGFSVPNG